MNKKPLNIKKVIKYLFIISSIVFVSIYVTKKNMEKQYYIPEEWHRHIGNECN